MFPCEIKTFPTRSALSIRFRSPVQELSAHFGRVYGAIGAYLAELGAQDQGEAVFAAYHNMDMQNLDIVAGFTISKPLPGKGEIQAAEIPGGPFAICHYTGPYDQVGPAYEELTQYAAQHGYQPGGVAYEWYLNGPDVPPQDLKTDVAFPVIPLGEPAKA
jgi:effector-binding domain-containing protein